MKEMKVMLPSIERPHKLPVVLSRSEIRLWTKYSSKISMSVSMKASIQMMIAGFFAIIFTFLLGETSQITVSEISVKSILALLYLILFGSIIAYLSFIWLIDKVPPAIVGTYTYINPLVAIFLGWSLLNENITIKQLIALAIILIGVIMVNLNKSKP
jgi:drug/metabolite transporter (DMT)-like permease